MSYQELPPGPDLAGRVAALWTQEIAEERTARVLPDGSMDIIWDGDGLHVAGPDTGPVLARVRAGERFAAVRFRPGAAGDLFGVPADALRDSRVPLRELWGGAAVERLEEAARGPGGDARLGVLEDEVRRRLAASRADPAAAAVAEALRSGGRVAEVARDLGLSERQLHRRSLSAFGYGPKVLQRVIRFQRALRLARRGVDLAEVAYLSGYADQAHLARDVRRLAGVPLTALL
ncbi:helix-turn-helix transcriptional regulator [Bailinhaonella thermotolerans]|uniref:AraC family transcriptional regulator n=1 Tax=Bailinhaonella thermotolerans TaxID=1070861 RepID=A0A3A4ADJ0_9ACTN|nr:helix-turn-helix transcriptional regulator [Bailinhaonella thermotolerans]RJL24724.1 AraC family transcriptional regulator [Bailinhaonella thermotolerans]